MNERYELRGIIGEGAFGVVYMAFDYTLYKTVTIKKVRLPALFEKQGAMVLMKINSPYCPLYIDSFEDKQYYYLVTSYISGKTLESYQRKLNGMQVCQLAKCMFMVLDQIWKMGYTFNDIKPANIIFDDKKKFYLIDFGSVSPKSTLQMRFGSRAFASKEYSKGQAFDWRSDLYSFSKTISYVYKTRSPFFILWQRKASHHQMIKRFKTPRQALIMLWISIFGLRGVLILLLVTMALFQPIQTICYQECLNNHRYLDAIKIDGSKLEAYDLFLKSRQIEDFKTWEYLLNSPIETVDDQLFLWNCVSHLMMFKNENAWVLIERILNEIDDLKAEKYLQIIRNPTLSQFKEGESLGAFIYAYGLSHLTLLDEVTVRYLCDSVIINESVSKENQLRIYAEFALCLNDSKMLEDAYELLNQHSMHYFIQASIAYRIFENGSYDAGWLHLAKNLLETVEPNWESWQLKIKIENQIMQWGSQA